MKKLIKTLPILMACTGIMASAIAGPHWGYEGKETPENWGKLSPEYQMCDLGKNQSPVNITGPIHAKVNNLEIHYDLISGTIINNGHTVQINDKNANDYLTVDGEQFKLTQFHFHAPSENQINGKTYPMEAHFVNQNKDGELLVMAVMLEEGKSNPIAAQLLSLLNDKENTPTNINGIDIRTFLPEVSDYYRFSGSLTTPPCSEGVTWIVLKQPITLSKSEITKFKSVFKHQNNRPIQPLHGRLIISN